MRNRFIAAFITFHMVLFVTSPAMAAMIPSQGSQQATGQEMQKEIDKIQRALESKLVQEKLKDYGLTADEVSAKLSSMTPAQIHTLAQASDDVLAGGDGLGAVIAVLVILILIIIILKLLHHDIIIKMTGIDGPDCADLPALC
jgi:predicted PurR-regulated permease PerM